MSMNVSKRGLITMPAIIAVNIVAFAGQLGFIRDHLQWPLAGDILFAGALESIAIFLAYHAHLALISNDSATRLRLASYGFGLIIGLLNYTHYSVNWKPNFEAVALGLMSASSPWLWGIHSRRESRDMLLANGLIDPHAARLGVNRWFWHSWWSIRVMYRATWVGETDPMKAIALLDDPGWRKSRTQRRSAPVPVAPGVAGQQSVTPAPQPPAITAPPEPVAAVASLGIADSHADTLARCTSDSERIRYAARAAGTDRPAEVASWLAARGVQVNSANVRSALSRSRRGQTVLPLQREEAPS